MKLVTMIGLVVTCREMRHVHVPVQRKYMLPCIKQFPLIIHLCPYIIYSVQYITTIFLVCLAVEKYEKIK